MRAKIAAGLCFALAGLGCLAGAAYEGLHYSSWANPGALSYAVGFFCATVLLLAVPAAMIVIGIAGQYSRSVSRLGLPPGQQLAAQVLLAGIVGEIWAEHNEAESRRLTESVMGPVRVGPQY